MSHSTMLYTHTIHSLQPCAEFVLMYREGTQATTPVHLICSIKWSAVGFSRSADYTVFVASRALEQKWRQRGKKSAGDQTEDDSEISNSLHASLAVVHADLTDSPPPTHAVPFCRSWEYFCSISGNPMGKHGGFYTFCMCAFSTHIHK